MAYHHSDLRSAVLTAALRRVRAGGMAALVAREIAREVGVSSAAVYRHFADIDHLRAEVSRGARQELAAAMIRARDGADPAPADGPAERPAPARARFDAAARAYVGFAVAEPGWFDAVFLRTKAPPSAPDDPSAWAVLTGLLDELVAAGDLEPGRRAAAPLIVWTATHGLGSIAAFGQLPPGLDVEVAASIVIDGLHRALGLR